MEVKIKSLGCIITGGGEGIDPIDAFGKFLAERVNGINLYDGWKTTTSDDDPILYMFKCYIRDMSSPCSGGVDDPYITYMGAKNTGDASSNINMQYDRFGYVIYKDSSDSFHYVVSTGIGTNNSPGNYWMICGPRSSSGTDQTGITVIPVTKNNLKNFKSFLESHPEIDLTEPTE